jgi:hypothetical protein
LKSKKITEGAKANLTLPPEGDGILKMLFYQSQKTLHFRDKKQ